MLPRRVFVVLLAAVLVLSFATQRLSPAQAHNNVPRIKWVRSIKLSENDDLFYATCVIGRYIAVVGAMDAHGGIRYPVIVLLDKTSGNIVGIWRGDDMGEFYNCLSINGRIYVVGTMGGKGVIAVFDDKLNVVVEAVDGTVNGYKALATDGTHLYVAGTAREDVDKDGYAEPLWVVKKYSLSPFPRILNTAKILVADSSDCTSSLIPPPFGCPSTNVYDMIYERSTGSVWVVGYYKFYNIDKPRTLVIIFDDSLKMLKKLVYGDIDDRYIGAVNAVCTDGSGNVYLGGTGGIVKMSRVGNNWVIVAGDKWYRISKLVCSNKFIYAFSRNTIPLEFYTFDKDLKLVSTLRLSGSELVIDFRPGRAAFDGYIVYAVADKEHFGYRGVVYAVYVQSTPSTTTMGPRLITITRTVTVTETETRISTVTKFVTVTETVPSRTVAETVTKTIPYTVTVTATKHASVLTTLITKTETVTGTRVVTEKETVTRTVTTITQAGTDYLSQWNPERMFALVTIALVAILLAKRWS